MKQKQNFMKLKEVYSFFILMVVLFGFSPVFPQGAAINTTGATAHSSAILDLSSSNQGVLVPRMTETEKNAISAPANGLLIYQTSPVAGFWYFDGSQWTQAIGPAGSTGPTGPTGPAGSNSFNYSSFASTVFENSSRYMINSGNSGSVNFHAGGANNSTSSNAGGFAQTIWSVWYSNSTDLMMNNPTVSTVIMTNNQMGSDFDLFVGIGNPTINASGIKFTDNHAGFKLQRTAGGDINLFASQADGYTETVSGVLTTVQPWYDVLEFIIQVNSGNNITYYWRKDRSALSAPTVLTSNMPSQQEYLSLGISNKNVASSSNMIWTSAVYVH